MFLNMPRFLIYIRWVVLSNKIYYNYLNSLANKMLHRNSLIMGTIWTRFASCNAIRHFQNLGAQQLGHPVCAYH